MRHDQVRGRRRELRRLLVDPVRLGASDGLLLLQSTERHYLGRVLRLRRGNRCEVVDGVGHLWTARLEDEDRLALEQPLAAPLFSAPVMPVSLELAMAIPRKAFDEVLRMVVELGVDRLHLLTAERSVAIPETPHSRWGTIVREACEQCGRLWLPPIEGISPAGLWFAQVPLHESCRLLATTRRSLPSLSCALSACRLNSGAREGGNPVDQATRQVVVAIGPEGGWTPQEETLAENRGWRPVSLSTQILRSATAAVTAACQLATWRDSINSPSRGLWPSP